MTPTRTAIVLFAASILLGLAVLLIDTTWWSFAFNASAFILALLGLDAILSPRRRRLDCRLSTADSLGIGDAGTLTVSIAPFSRSWRTAVELLYDAEGPAAPAPTVTALLEPDTGCEAALPIQPLRRGTIRITGLWLRWQGPLSLIQTVHFIALTDTTIHVLPNIRTVKAGALQLFQRDSLFGSKSQLERGSGTEFDALREYQPGFDTRFIDWKHSARHRKLLCKEFRVERNHQVVLAIDHGRLMNEPLGGLARLDHAINAALSLGWVALRTGDLVGLFEFDSTVRHYLKPMRGANSFAHLRRRSAEIAYSPDETNFTLALAELDQRLDRRALIILFTDFVDTVSAELLVENLQRVVRRHFVLFVTLRDPFLGATVDRRPNDFPDAARAVIAHDMLKDRAIVFERLARLGIHCLDVPHDRLSAGLVNRYLEIKQRDLI